MPTNSGDEARNRERGKYAEVSGISRRPKGAAPPIVRSWILPMVAVIIVAVLFCTAFYVIDSVIFGSGPPSILGIVNHYLAFDPALITDALPALGMTIVAVLGIVLTVVAIIVQLSSERYTGVAIMFLREPTHIAVISFYIVASLCAVWLSVTLRPDFVPTSLLLLVMVLTSLGLAVMLPYFAYTFWFLEPSNIINRLRLHTTGLAERGLASSSEEEIGRLQGRVLQQMGEITDIANNSIEGRDKIIAVSAIDALCDFGVHYISDRSDTTHPWYRFGEEVRFNPDFVAMDSELLAELENRGLWVEWKTMHELLRVYQEALGTMSDINSQVAIDTRYLGEAAAAARQTDLVRMVFRFFNCYLQAAIDQRIEQTADAVLLQYRMLLEDLLRRDLSVEACEGVRFMRFYGYLAFEEELPAITEISAYDIASLCRYAYTQCLGCDRTMLAQLLSLDAEEAVQTHRHYRGLSGVRKAQIRLGIYYLSMGEDDSAQLIADDMSDMTEEARVELHNELLNQSPPHVWEILDRGRNLHYLAESERAYSDRFLAMAANRSD